jgi:4-amino-4-deoxy-L-arabinose transferase-like glycosyltransferase
MDTNKPAALIWAVALYTSHRAFQGDRRMWAVTGLMIGLGLLTRYTILFLVVALVLAVVIFHRRYLRERGPYVMFLCSLACVPGLLHWQYEHQWLTLQNINPTSAVIFVSG